MTRLPGRAFIAICSLAGCLGTSEPGPDALIDRWRIEAEALKPRGTMTVELTLTAAGRFSDESRTLGLYAWQTADELSSFSRTVGRYHVDGKRLLFEADSLITFDSFHGQTEPAVRTPYPYRDGPYDQATYEIRGNRLTLHYITYPADGPEPTTRVFRRAGEEDVQS